MNCSIVQHEIISPFARLRSLLGDSPPGVEPAIDLTIGAPRHAPPAFARAILDENFGQYGEYPSIRPIPELGEAIARWLARRYGEEVSLDPGAQILPLLGSREGLFSSAFIASRLKPRSKPLALMPNPFYSVYAAAAMAASMEPHYLAATRASGFLPDLEELAEQEELLARASVLYLCSPSNPQGAVASMQYWRKAAELARKHDFMLFADECYSEIYYGEKPAGALEAAFALDGSPANVVIFNSLSKRSNLPGLRSGFAAGDEEFMRAFHDFRNVTCPQMPLPAQRASAAIWSDEEHVEENRRLYAAKMEMAEEMLQGRFGFARPGGGFFLWLDMKELGGGEKAAERFWKGCGVKMLPGAYFACEPGSREEGGMRNPASDDVRIALVHDLETTRRALERLVAVSK
jgi:aspartate/methionine/tyrosine aminotransferase